MLPVPDATQVIARVSGESAVGVYHTELRHLTGLAPGLIANTGKGAVTGMLTDAGLAGSRPHDRTHSFFSRAGTPAGCRTAARR